MSFHTLFELLAEERADIKKQIEDNMAGWMYQPYDTLQIATQFFEELKIVLVLQIENRSAALETSSPILFISPKTFLFYYKKFADIVKDLDLGNKSWFCWNLHSFS